MATFMIDLDGVISKHSTMEFNDGALSYLKKIKDEGHNLDFTTARKAANNNIPSLQLDLSIAKLNDSGIDFDSIVECLEITPSRSIRKVAIESKRV